MSEESLHTTQMHDCLERMRAGDMGVRDELLRRIGRRLEHLARRMLRKFPNLAPWVDSGDVLSGAVMRLLRSLQKVKPESMRAFYGLAALHVRRELLDLARRFGREWQARRGGLALHADDSSAAPFEPAAAAEDPDLFEQWVRFHEEVGNLPAEEREVVGLIYYHGWQHEEVAGVLQVSTRTVRRRWESALGTLSRALGEA